MPVQAGYKGKARERRTCKAALRESAAAEAAGLYRLGDAALDICKRSRAKSTDAAGTAVCGPLAGNAGKECGAGTGKSFMAGCIANALMEQEVAVCMTNFARIMNELNNAFSGRNEVVDRLCGYPLLVIDDFGMERGTEYALEQIYNIIDSRYRSRKPLIVTTNLTLTELKNPQDTAHARIYDRLLELCTPIACTGPSMRKDIGQAKLNLLKTLLA